MPTYTVVAADLLRDRQVITEIWKRNLSTVERLEEKFDWHFIHNPSGLGRCWLLLADGLEVGATSLGMRLMKAGDRVLSAGVACDLCVDRKHRLLLPALLLQKAMIGAVSDELPLVYGLPNPDGAAPIRRAGYRDAGLVHRYTKVLRLAPYFERYLKLGLAPVFGLLDHAYAAICRLRERLNRDYVVAALPAFDSRFDKLWEDSKDDHAIIGVRDSRFLRWRYQQCPLQAYTTLGLLSRDKSRLLGYLISYMDGNRMMCADMFAGRNPEYVPALLSAAAAYGRRIGAISMAIHCSVPPAFLASLQRLGFHRRSHESQQGPPADRGRTLLAYAGASGLDVLTHAWYFTPGDEPYN